MKFGVSDYVGNVTHNAEIQKSSQCDFPEMGELYLCNFVFILINADKTAKPNFTVFTALCYASAVYAVRMSVRPDLNMINALR